MTNEEYLLNAFSEVFFELEELAKMPDNEFAKWYLEKMRIRWNEKEMPKCCDCYKQIEKPEDLRIYYGLKLHADCFKKSYALERLKKTETSRAYWDKVANLSFE